MKYRKATPKDQKRIAEVLFENYNIKTKKEALKITKEEFEKGFHYVIANNNGKIVGIACWAMHGRPKHKLAHCARVAVLPEHREKGIAKKLFKKMVQEADKFYKSQGQKMRKMYAYAHSSNKLAQQFYKRRGFILEAKLKDHYYKGEDEYIYSMFFE
ncbi:GNAT family N-acetyltransferase [Candidatus Woesearchaeota archaeon]|nr:GNAT family N-acetyltransferase [Candidatus Woesearchaeota archaeon]